MRWQPPMSQSFHILLNDQQLIHCGLTSFLYAYTLSVMLSHIWIFTQLEEICFHGSNRHTTRHR